MLLDPALGRAAAARLPHRQHRRGAAAARRPLRGRRLQDQLARPARPATSRSRRPTTLPPLLARGDDRGAHYPLQALLYCVALHRYLRWRLPGYAPERAPRRGAVPVRARDVRPRPRRPSTACRAGCSAGTPPAALVIELSAAAGRGRRAIPAHEPTATSGDLRDARLALGRPGLLAPFNAAGVLEPPTCTSPPGWAGSAARPTSEVLLAVALAVRAVRLGSVCVDLADGRPHRARRGRRGARHIRAAVAGARGLAGRVPGVAAGGRRRRGRHGRPLRLVAGSCCTWSGTGTRRSSCRTSLQRARRRRRRPRVDLARAARRAGPAVPRARCACASGRPRRSASLRRVTVLAGGPGTGKTTTVAAAAGRCCSTSPAGRRDRAGRPHRQGRGPAAGGGHRALLPAAPARPRRPRRPRCTGCCGWRPGAPGLPARPPRTGCPTTWWWSTRRRWCR